MKKILVTDFKNSKKYLVKNFYHKIYLVGYSRDLEKINFNNFNNIEFVSPVKNFDKAYHYIKKIFKENFNNKNIIFLNKICREDFFNIGLINLAIDKEQNRCAIYLDTEYNNSIKIFNKKKNLFFLSFNRNYLNLIKSFFKILFVYYKSILYVLNFSRFIKYKSILVMDYKDKRTLGFLKLDKYSSININHETFGNFLTLKDFFYFFRTQFNYCKYVNNEIIFKNFYIQALTSLQFLTLASTYKPKIIIGSLDSSNYADIASNILKKKNIQFYCMAHAHNYNFRIDYMHIPFDKYFVWSKEHLRSIKKNNYIKSKCKFFITGSSNFKLLKKFHYNKNTKKVYDLLVVGEFFYDDLSKQPFNRFDAAKMALVLSKFSTKIKICIRPRFKNDGFLKCMKFYLKDTVKYYIPNEENSATTILEQIQKSKAVLGVFTGAIHDAIALKKPVIQFNVIGIKEPKGLDKYRFVNYANTTKKLEFYLDEIVKGKICYKKPILHNKIFLNDKIFDDKIIYNEINKGLK